MRFDSVKSELGFTSDSGELFGEEGWSAENSFIIQPGEMLMMELTAFYRLTPALSWGNRVIGNANTQERDWLSLVQDS